MIRNMCKMLKEKKRKKGKFLKIYIYNNYRTDIVNF